MKSVDVNSSTFIDFDKENNEKDSTFNPNKAGLFESSFFWEGANLTQKTYYDTKLSKTEKEPLSWL